MASRSCLSDRSRARARRHPRKNRNGWRNTRSNCSPPHDCRRPEEGRPERSHDFQRNRHTGGLGASRHARHRESGSEERGCSRRDSQGASGQQTPPGRPRATMTSKKRQRAASKASKTRRSRADGSRIKLAEAFLADLDRSWEQHGRAALDRVRTERPSSRLERADCR